MEEVIIGITHVGEKSGEISDSTSSIENTATAIVGISTKMYNVISTSSSNAFIQTVKMDHVIWKLDVYQVILGVSQKSVNDFANHQACRLGKWYYQGEGAEQHAANHSFKLLEIPHTQVHTHGVNAINAMNAGNMNHAIQELSIMESASVEVINILTSLSQEIENNLS